MREDASPAGIVLWLHKLIDTRSWKHYQKHGHWPAIRYESELLDTEYDGFSVCTRCTYAD